MDVKAYAAFEAGGQLKVLDVHFLAFPMKELDSFELMSAYIPSP